MKKLQTTSERVIVEDYQSGDGKVVLLQHLATYKFAQPFVAGKRVLDLGCGSGYGTEILASTASSVIGIDVAEDAVSYAKQHYQRPNLGFATLPANGTLPFQDRSFDIVTSFQVIEHVADVDLYLCEARRVLSHDGMFVVATPDRSCRLFWFQKPWNPWHLTEYDANGLRESLLKYFSAVDLYSMGGSEKLMTSELARYRKAKYACLPFTLPFMPDAWRMRILKSISGFLRSNSAKKKGELALTIDDIRIELNISPSLNIIALARV